MGFFSANNPFKQTLPTPEQALPGREQAIVIEGKHPILQVPLMPPYPEDRETVMFGLGCFWGAERKFWKVEGVYVTAVGYAGGITPNPTYEEVCSGKTGHNEVVLVVYSPQKVSFNTLLSLFWESHDPTQLMRQGNDVGTQYRSAIYCSNEAQLELANISLKQFQGSLTANGFGDIATEIIQLSTFYYAEEYHQQYLWKNPNGYCGLGGLGVSCNLHDGAN